MRFRRIMKIAVISLGCQLKSRENLMCGRNETNDSVVTLVLLNLFLVRFEKARFTDHNDAM